MPIETHVSMLDKWFTVFTCLKDISTTVSMEIQYVIGWSNFSSWWEDKANWSYESTSNRYCIWLRRWFKPHHCIIVVLMVLLKDFLVHRCKAFSVSDTWPFYSQVMKWITRKRFVKRIISHNPRILCKASRCIVPECYEFVLQTVFIEHQRISESKTFLGCIINCKVFGLTILYKRITIFVHSEPIKRKEAIVQKRCPLCCCKSQISCREDPISNR